MGGEAIARITDPVGLHGGSGRMGGWTGLVLGALAGIALIVAAPVVIGVGVVGTGLIGAACIGLGAVSMVTGAAHLGGKIGQYLGKKAEASGGGGGGGGPPCSAIAAGSPKTLAQSKLVARIGDVTSHNRAALKSGAAKVFEGGKPVSRVGESATCGASRVISGAPKVIVGGPSVDSGAPVVEPPDDSFFGSLMEKLDTISTVTGILQLPLAIGAAVRVGVKVALAKFAQREGLALAGPGGAGGAAAKTGLKAAVQAAASSKGAVAVKAGTVAAAKEGIPATAMIAAQQYGSEPAAQFLVDHAGMDKELADIVVEGAMFAGPTGLAMKGGGSRDYQLGKAKEHATSAKLAVEDAKAGNWTEAMWGREMGGGGAGVRDGGNLYPGPDGVYQPHATPTGQRPPRDGGTLREGPDGVYGPVTDVTPVGARDGGGAAAPARDVPALPRPNEAQPQGGRAGEAETLRLPAPEPAPRAADGGESGGARADGGETSGGKPATEVTPRLKDDPPRTYEVQQDGQTFKIIDETKQDAYGHKYQQLRVDGAPPGQGTLVYGVVADGGTVHMVDLEKVVGIKKGEGPAGAGKALKTALLDHVVGDKPLTSRALIESNEAALMKVVSENPLPSMKELEAVPALRHPGYDYTVDFDTGMARLTMKRNGSSESRLMNPEIFTTDGYREFLNDTGLGQKKLDDALAQGKKPAPPPPELKARAEVAGEAKPAAAAQHGEGGAKAGENCATCGDGAPGANSMPTNADTLGVPSTGGAKSAWTQPLDVVAKGNSSVTDLHTPKEAEARIRSQYADQMSPAAKGAKPSEMVAILSNDEFVAYAKKVGFSDERARLAKGFCDEDGFIFLNRDKAPAEAVYHETLHAFTAPEFRKLGQGVNEGFTEWLTRKELSHAGAPSESSYKGVGALTERVESLVGADVMRDAYFGGKVDALRSAWESKMGTSFDTVLESMQKMHDRDVTKAKAAADLAGDPSHLAMIAPDALPTTPAAFFDGATFTPKVEKGFSSSTKDFQASPAALSREPGKFRESTMGWDDSAIPHREVAAMAEAGHLDGAVVMDRITGGDGVERAVLKMPTEYAPKGHPDMVRQGYFEFMREPDGSINHARFKEDPAFFKEHAKPPEAVNLTAKGTVGDGLVSNAKGAHAAPGQAGGGDCAVCGAAGETKSAGGGALSDPGLTFPQRSGGDAAAAPKSTHALVEQQKVGGLFDGLKRFFKKDEPVIPPETVVGTRAADVPLFGPDGPKPDDIRQGHIGDCYLMATLQSLARRDPQAIRDMIKANPDGSYDVTITPHVRRAKFDDDGVHVVVESEPATIRVDNSFPVRQDGAWHAADPHQASWPAIIEKAYAEHQGGGAGYEGIGNGGLPWQTMQDFGLDGGKIETAHATDLFATMYYKNADGLPMVAATRPLGPDSGAPPWLFGSHAYSVQDVAKLPNGAEVIELFNPHNKARTGGGRFTMPVDEFSKYFSYVSVGYEP